MDIHRPKPVHGWGELAKEVGIIVLGVLIALGAEQAVEALHWDHKVREAAEAMRLELRDDDAPQAYTRVAVAPCFDGQLDAIQSAIESGHARGEIVALVNRYTPPSRTWDSEAWKAAVASDVGSHVPAEQMIDWSKPYRTMPDLQTVNNQERADRNALQPTRRQGQGLSAGEADTMLAAVQRLRDENREMGSLARTLLFGLDKFKMSMAPDQQRKILEGLRTRFGACVAAPSIAGVDPNDQLDSFRHP
jgi:hypothetical protein